MVVFRRKTAVMSTSSPDSIIERAMEGYALERRVSRALEAVR